MSLWWVPLAVIGGYILLAIVLLKAACCCRKRRPHFSKRNNFAGAVLLGSHRGGSLEAVENTITAFQHSYDLGLDMFELDVHITRDDQVIVYHDASIVRLTGQEGLVAEMDLKDFPPVMDELTTHLSRGTYRVKAGEFRGVTLL